jgi:hypothetical protein
MGPLICISSVSSHDSPRRRRHSVSVRSTYGLMTLPFSVRKRTMAGAGGCWRLLAVAYLNFSPSSTLVVFVIGVVKHGMLARSQNRGLAFRSLGFLFSCLMDAAYMHGVRLSNICFTLCMLVFSHFTHAHICGCVISFHQPQRQLAFKFHKGKLPTVYNKIACIGQKLDGWLLVVAMERKRQ